MRGGAVAGLPALHKTESAFKVCGAALILARTMWLGWGGFFEVEWGAYA
jgi:hypothetical protein